MPRVVAVICFACLIAAATYIYINFESVNFIPTPIQISSSSNNRVISGGHHVTPTPATHYYPEGTTNSSVWLSQSIPAITRMIFPLEKDSFVPAVPPQSWVSTNIRRVLQYLGLSRPVQSKWLRAKYLSLIKTYYSPKTGVVYTGIPKSGCTNWKFTILKIEGMFPSPTPNPKVHYIINELNLVSSMHEYSWKILDRAFTFTVIRNPWSRMVSGYNDKFSSSRMGMWHKGKIALQILNNYRSKNITLRDIRKRGVSPTFMEFLQHLAFDPIDQINPHFHPQYNMLDLENVHYDYVSALEHAKVQSEEIFQHFKTRNLDSVSVPGPYDSSSDPRTERSTILAKKWFSDISPELIDILYTRYKPDFMIMNYSNFTDPLFPFPLYNSDY